MARDDNGVGLGRISASFEFGGFRYLVSPTDCRYLVFARGFSMYGFRPWIFGFKYIKVSGFEMDFQFYPWSTVGAPNN
jgi:hypothetical protein